MAFLKVNKKKGLIVIVIFLLFTGGFYYYKNYFKASQNIKNPVGEKLSPTPLPTKTWKDPMGFSFDYPDFMTVNPHNEDQDNYAHVELAATGSSGSIIVWAKDTNFQTLDGWLKGDKTVSGGTSLDTTWGGQPAKKVAISGENPRVETGVLYDGLLWVLDGVSGGDNKFDTAYNNILTNFKFYPLNQSATSGGDTSGGTDGGGDEEIVQ